MSNALLDALESRVNSAVETIDGLRAEIRDLREERRQLADDRTRLQDEHRLLENKLRELLARIDAAEGGEGSADAATSTGGAYGIGQHAES
ncbi:MAG TPA: cell division protein ZapB [bacterium]